MGDGNVRGRGGREGKGVGVSAYVRGFLMAVFLKPSGRGDLRSKKEKGWERRGNKNFP